MAGKVNLADLVDEEPTPDARVPSFTSGSRAVPIDQVAPNPKNTRRVNARPGKIAKLAKSINEHGQIEPVAVVTRSAFLAIFPEYADAIGAARYVQVTGGRRYAAIMSLGRPTIDIAVNDDRAATRAGFVAATMAENVDRENLDPVEEAHAVQQLVEEYGSKQTAAQHMKRSPGWVSQRLNLLRLVPDVQEALCADPDDEDEEDNDARLPLRVVRDWHEKRPDEQIASLEAWRAAKVNSAESETNKGDDASAQSGSRSRPSRHAAAIRRLGETAAVLVAGGQTQHQIAVSLSQEISREQLTALVQVAQELLPLISDKAEAA